MRSRSPSGRPTTCWSRRSQPLLTRYYFSGDLAAASAAAQRALAHPEAERRPTAHAVARSTLALADLDRGLLDAARSHAEKARALVGAIHSTRSWLGAIAYATSGSVHAAEGKLVEAERELVYAERFFHDELATVHHAWLLLLLARVALSPRSPERGERDAAPRASASSTSSSDCGTLPRARVERRARARAGRAPAPTVARCSRGRARPSSRCSGCWHPSCRPATSADGCSSRPTPFARTPARSTGSSASTHARGSQCARNEPCLGRFCARPTSSSIHGR